MLGTNVFSAAKAEIDKLMHRVRAMTSEKTLFMQ